MATVTRRVNHRREIPSWEAGNVVRAAISTVVALAGCGRIGFDAGTSIEDARSDVADAATTFGPWMTPTEVPTMSSASMDFGPTFSPDTTEVYLSQRITGDADIYRYKRSSSTTAFSAGVAVAELNIAVSEEGEPSLSDDGLTIYFNRYTPNQIFTSTRSSAQTTDWSTPVLAETLHPNLAGFHSADFAGDLRMVVTKDGMIWEATRASPTDPWGAPISLGITGNVPCMRRDGLELLHEGATTINGMPSLAIFRHTRASVTEAFGPPEQLSFGALDVAGVGDPELSHDGRTLIFSAEEVLGNVTYDIYISERGI